MGKKLYLLACFLLVVGVNSTSRAASIDVNNHSFEYDINGVQITELTGWDSVKGWVMRDTTGWAAGWQFVDDEWWGEGYYEAADGNVCSFNVTSDEPDDANASCQMYQILDPNVDANAVISENRRYTLTFNALRLGTEDIPTVYGALFYSVGGVNVAPANDVILAEDEVFLTLPPWGEVGYAGWEEISLTYTAFSGAGSIGETLGVKLSVPTHEPWFEGYQVVLDNVRVDWLWATDAWGPYPADGAREVARDVTVGWKPGVWVQDTDGHEVYFGTDETAVQDATTSSAEYQGAEDGNSWSVLNYDANGLELGRTYYWRVDEVNEAYSGTNPPAPPDGRWKGPVWSFRTTGYAINPSPYDGERDVPFLGLELSWTAGTEAESHVVYFGTDEEAVADATTSSPEYETTLSLGTESYPITAGLTVGQTYYWRIDEKSAGGSHIITGDVWRFTVGMFLVVDDFESYAPYNLLDVWDDYWENSSGAEIFLEKDVNYIRDIDNPQALLCWYTNSDKTVGSHFDAQDMSELEIGSDWTIGGVKALQLWMRGDPCSVLKNNAEGWPWVELEDTSSNSGYVLYPEAYIGDILDDSWHEWNISLSDANFSGVELTAIDRLTIGIGGAKAGQKQANEHTNLMWFDDIRLYPPRCRTDVEGVVYFNSKGDLTGPDGMIDCTVDYYDLDVMTDEWLRSGQWVSPAAPASAPEVWYRFDDGPSSTVVKNDGLWSSDYDIAISSPNEADEPSWTSDTAPALDRLDPNYAMDFDGVDDYLEIPNSPATNFSGTENMTITTWMKGPQVSWSALVCSAKGSGDRHATGIGTSGTAGHLCYFWNENEWWWDPGLEIPDEQWAFLAVAVEPTQATMYLYDGNDLSIAANVVEHGALEEFGTDDFTVIGQDAKTDPEAESAYLDGMLDDVRLYNKTLTIAEIAGLCGIEELLYVPLDSVADLVVGIKDPNDPNQPVDDQIDFMDYDIMAGNWLEQYLWP